MLDSLEDHSDKVPEATTTDLSTLSVPTDVTYNRLPQARGLSEALDVAANKLLREHRYAGASAGDLEVTGSVFAVAHDTIAARLRACDATGDVTSTIYYRGNGDRPFTSPGLIERDAWRDFAQAVVTVASAIDGLDVDTIAVALREQPRPWGNGPTMVPAKNGDLHALFPSAQIDGEYSTVALVIPAAQIAPMLSADGKAVVAAVEHPSEFDPQQVTHHDPGTYWGDRHYVEPRAVPSSQPSRSADTPGPVSQLAPRSPAGTRPASVAAPDATRLRAVALSFDDGPAPTLNQELREDLDRHRAAATFFMIGQSVSAHPEWCTRTAVDGFEIGSHTWSHPQLSRLSDTQLDDEIGKAAHEIEKAAGRPPFVMRPPYGDQNSGSLDTVDRYGESSIMWDVDTLDWKALDVGSNLANVQKETRRGSIILMHEIHRTSVRAVPRILRWLEKQDYTLLTASEIGQNQMVGGRHYSTGPVTHTVTSAGADDT